MSKERNPTHPTVAGGCSRPGAPVSCPLPTEYHLHLDADRDGAVDNDRTGLSSWNWGAGGKGAIVLVNNDDDGGRTAGHRSPVHPRLDNGDNLVNQSGDVPDLTPLIVRRTGPIPSGWMLFLEISATDAARLRIFDSRSAGGSEVIGPTSRARWQLPNISFTEMELGMEAVRYAGDFRPGPDNDHGSFTGEIMITLEVRAGGAITNTERGVVRVAPWIIPHHLDSASRVYVIEFPLGVPPGTQRTPGTAQRPDNSQFINELRGFVTASGCTLVTHPDGDPWIQDGMEVGWSASVTHQFPVFSRSSQNRGLSGYPQTLAGPNKGYLEQGAMRGGTYDSNGNLEATPPCAVTINGSNRRFPFGRIYYGAGAAGHPGDSFDQQRRTFLERQIVQAPIPVDTDWLSVGHVDEMVSILPGGGSQGFKLAIASPRRAYAILDANRIAHGHSRLLSGRRFARGGRWVSAEVSIADFLNIGISSLSLTATSLRSYNLSVQRRLDAVCTQFQNNAGVQIPGDIVEIPVIFKPDNPGAYTRGAQAFAEALTADSVNMLVINRHCVVPMPFGPVMGATDLFREAIETDLSALGLTLHFIDDWYEYHIAEGEVPCGTNTLRSPTSTQWWEFLP